MNVQDKLGRPWVCGGALLVYAISGCVSPEEELALDWRDGESEQADDVEPDGRELVHESIRRVSPDGSSVLVSSTGEVTAEIEQATARPWTHMSEEFIYNDESWMTLLDDGDLWNCPEKVDTFHAAMPAELGFELRASNSAGLV